MLDLLMAIQKIANTAKTREAMWQAILTEAEVARMAEVGVYRGAFAESVLGACEIEAYTMIDPWQPLPNWHKPANHDAPRFDEIFAEAMQRTDFAADKRHVLRCTTKEAASQIDAASLDMVYIDGDHTLRGITLDLTLMYGKLRAGGLLGGDDFTMSVWQHGPDFDPTFVCPYAIYFAEAMDVPIIILPFLQFLILKEPTLGFEVFHLVDEYKNLRLNELMQMPARFKERNND